MYDGQGNPVTDYDPAKGRLEMQKRIHHQRGRGSRGGAGALGDRWRSTPETGGRDVQWVVDAPGGGSYPEAWDEEETYWLYIPYTEEELAQMEEAKNRPSAEELLAALMEGIEHA